METKIVIKRYRNPGLNLGDDALEKLSGQIREVARACFPQIPDYQAMRGTRQALSDKLISVATDEGGRPLGFCSMVLLDVDGVGKVLHLGLTCVHPRARGCHLTHLLVKKVLVPYLLLKNPFGKVWISNCAAVLSSLGNVAMHFEGVFPSPFCHASPTPAHLCIADAIDRRFRQEMFIPDHAILDREKFIFRGSVGDTVFQKNRDDRAFYHRKDGLNRFYAGLMDFGQGDEVLQVGYFRMATLLRYLTRKTRMKTVSPAPALEQ